MNKVQMAAKIYDARDSMKRLFKDDYPAKMTEYRAYIETSMERNDCDALHAMMHIMKGLQKIDGSEMNQALIMAAAVEVIEG